MTTIYRALLLLLPGWFREEFAAEMTADFSDSLRDGRRGRAARLRLALTTVRDLIVLASRLHADAVRQDTVYALRTLRRSPAFTLAAVATLALGLGPTMVVANLVERVVLRPLPFEGADRLVSIWNAQPARNRREVPLSAPDFADFRDRQQTLDAIAAHAGTSVAWISSGDPRQLAGVLTSSDLFGVLGVQPRLGRPLTPADSAPGAPPVVVLGHQLWMTEFGGRADVIGRTVRVDGVVTEIVGVLPDGLEFPNGSQSFWMPLTLDPQQFTRGSRFLNSTARLRPGVTAQQAAADLNAIARALGETYPDTNHGQEVEIISLKAQLNGDAPRLLGVLAVAIVAVLLIACTNVASLLAVRASTRETELALRAAIGATGRRLRRQLLMEHLILAVLGGAAAVAIALPLHRTIVRDELLALPRTPESLGWPSYAALVLSVAGIAAAFAWLTSRRTSEHGATLLRAARSTGLGSQVRLRRALVVIQVAAALVLVVVAGLMIRSATRLAAVDPGFQTDRVLTFGVVLPGSTYNSAEQRQLFISRVVDELQALPGVAAASSGGYAPMGQMRATRRFAPADRPPPQPGAEPVAIDIPVGPGYFEVMGVPLIAGRTFDQRDVATAPPVLIVSEAFARDVFPGESAIGKRIAFYSSRPGATPPPTREVVGVVRDVRQDGVSRRPIPQMYAPYAQSSWGFTSFFVRVNGDAAAVAGSLQRAVSRVDPMRPIRDVLSTTDIVRQSLSRQRALTAVLGALAVTALLLATIGLYGVSATAASARSRELAIRTAVGAPHGALLRLLIRQGVTTGAIGVALGLGAALAVAGGLDAWLYETPPRDPWTFAATAALLLAVSTAATVIPGRRALTANPADVLRTD
jgi:putative ABC transport system permease protein